jgi:integrase
MLTDVQIRAIKPDKKIKCVTDEKGLYLEVRPSGAFYWRLKYRHAGRENRLSMGVYPETTLKAARAARDAARKLLSEGIDPSQARKAEKISVKVSNANTFEHLALEWHTAKKSGWSTSHTDTCLERMKRDLFPWLGTRPLADLTPPEILAVLKRVESRGSIETAHRCKGIVSQVFDYCIATGRADTNPAQALGAALKSKVGGNHPAIVEPGRLGQMLRDIDAYAGSPITRAALQMHALTFQRPNEVSGMTWGELDLDGAMWVIPAPRMKRTVKAKASGAPHYVPLSRQAVEVLRELQPLTGSTSTVFPGERGQGRSISENTARMGLRSMGYTDHTPHGFRATARTLARQELRIDREVIERQLAHNTGEKLGGAYDRAEFMTDRVKLMQAWADYLDRLKTAASTS